MEKTFKKHVCLIHFLPLKQKVAKNSRSQNFRNREVPCTVLIYIIPQLLRIHSWSNVQLVAFYCLYHINLITAGVKKNVLIHHFP